MSTSPKSGVCLSSNQLVRAVYDYETNDPKVLSISAGERFIIIKNSRPQEWLYVVNSAGKLGYIPANYVEADLEIDDSQYLEYIDSVVSLLDAKHNDTNSTTVRQINHAQVKLTQIRCEIVQRIYKDSGASPDVNDNPDNDWDGETSEKVFESIPEESAKEAVDSHENQNITQLEEAEDDDGEDEDEEEEEVTEEPKTVELKKVDVKMVDMEKVDVKMVEVKYVKMNDVKMEEVDIQVEDVGVDVDEVHVVVEEVHVEVEDVHVEVEKVHVEVEKVHVEVEEVDIRVEEVKVEADVKTEEVNVEAVKVEVKKVEPKPKEVVMKEIDELKDDEVVATEAKPGLTEASTQTEQATRKLSLSCGESGPTPEAGLIPENLISELIERIRVSTELSHEMCKQTIRVVINCLGESMPHWLRKCNQIIQQLNNEEMKCATPEAMLQSSDFINLKAIFRKLWYCQSDEQQRSWPVHEDEVIIKAYLQELTKLLANANPSISRDIICKYNYDNVHMLVAYFQMETRRSLRMELYQVLLEVIRLTDSVIPNYLLSSVFPAALADEMLNYKDDPERWGNASLLFTAVFSTGHKPSVNLYEHINEHFITKLMDIVEGEDSSGNKLPSDIPLEASIPPILAFNLQFEEKETNFVLKALTMRPNASQLTENLVSYLNWEEDPTLFSSMAATTQEEPKLEIKRPNAVHKLLIEIFDDPEIAKLFYYNDVRVVIDIIITHLNNLQAGDKTRVSYLTLAQKIMKNTSYREEPHKLVEMTKCLVGIESHECSSVEEKQLASSVKALLPEE